MISGLDHWHGILCLYAQYRICHSPSGGMKHHNERAIKKKKIGYMKPSYMNLAAAAVLRNCYGAEIPAVDVAGNAHIFQGGIRQCNTTKVAILRIKYTR